MRLHNTEAFVGMAGLQVFFDGTLRNLHQLADKLGTACSECDVIRAAFEKWNSDFPRHLEGEFCIAILDFARDSVQLVRDHFGSIPLYYAIADGRLLFGSHMDEFLESGCVRRAVSRQAIWNYLSIGAIPEKYPILADVQCVMPGECRSVNLKTGAYSSHRWWNILEESREKLTTASMVERIGNASSAMIQGRNPVLLLSGGLDSASILAAMSVSGIKCRTLTLGYESKYSAFDESSSAKLLADTFKADASFCKITGKDVACCMDAFLHSMDQPSRDGLNIFLASKAAHETGADSIITGLGGDELLGGYQYVARYAANDYSNWKTKLFAPVFKRLPDRFRHNLMLPFLNRLEKMATVRVLLYENAKRKCVCSDFMNGFVPVDWQSQCQEWLDDEHLHDIVEQLGYFDIKADMVHTLLRDAFCHSYSNGMSALAPMLEPSFAADAFAVPTAEKLVNGRGKFLLRQAFENILPAEILFAGKRGFEIPFIHWMNNELAPRVKAAFMSSSAKMIFAENACVRWAGMAGNIQPRDYALWSRFILVEWLAMRNISELV